MVADLERWYAARANTHANTHTVEIEGASHAVYVSRPKEVVDVIESAARMRPRQISSEAQQ